MPGADYTGIKGILVYYSGIFGYRGIPWGSQTFGRFLVHTLSTTQGCHSTVPVCLTHWEVNCRNIVFSFSKLQGFQDLFRAENENGAKSKSYLVNRLPFSEPSLLGTIGKMRLVFILMPSVVFFATSGRCCKGPKSRQVSGRVIVSKTRVLSFHHPTIGNIHTRDMENHFWLCT
jgi:hypothetical protein